jgi:hypothetical protein
MCKKCTDIFRLKALKNVPKLDFFVLKICHLATLILTVGNVEVDIETQHPRRLTESSRS